MQELDRDAPDYDRALVELAAFLQRIAIVQIVPEAAQHDEEFDAQTLARLAQAMSPEDVQLYYQIALGGRRDLAMAPEPRLGFEMTLLRMLAFRPETARPRPRRGGDPRRARPAPRGARSRGGTGRAAADHAGRARPHAARADCGAAHRHLHARGSAACDQRKSGPAWSRPHS